MPSESENENNGSTVEEYRNVATQVLSKFMQKDKMDTDGDINSDSMAAIDFEAPKISPSTSLETLAAALDYELTEKEWFVTGNVNPSYFSPDFQFQDPDVKVDSIEDYSKGVRKIFNQSTSRAEILSTVVNEEASTPEKSVITITWRLSGGVNIGFGLDIKPYIVYTDFVIDPETSLVIFQEDRFDIPSWDILLRCVSFSVICTSLRGFISTIQSLTLVFPFFTESMFSSFSALFPFVIGKITSPAAPSVPARDLTMPKVDFIGSKTPNPSMSFGGIFKSFMGSQ